jgi:hypothetical protein
MVLPEAVKILYLPVDHTDCIGRYAEGQFLVDHAAPYIAGQSHWCLVLHLFDDDGRHVRSHTWSGPTGDRDVLPKTTGHRRAERQLHLLLDALPDRRYGDITIRPFRFDEAGIVYGLIDESGPHDGELYVLYPGGLLLRPPWYGSYECQHGRRPDVDRWNGVERPPSRNTDGHHEGRPR